VAFFSLIIKPFAFSCKESLDYKVSAFLSISEKCRCWVILSKARAGSTVHRFNQCVEIVHENPHVPFVPGKI
jgi:hypothetical protein